MVGPLVSHVHHNLQLQNSFDCLERTKYSQRGRVELAAHSHNSLKISRCHPWTISWHSRDRLTSADTAEIVKSSHRG